MAFIRNQSVFFNQSGPHIGEICGEFIPFYLAKWRVKAATLKVEKNRFVYIVTTPPAI